MYWERRSEPPHETGDPRLEVPHLIVEPQPSPAEASQSRDGSVDCTALNLRVVAWAVFGWVSTMCRVRMHSTTLSSGPGPFHPKEQTGAPGSDVWQRHGASSLVGPEASPCTRQKFSPPSSPALLLSIYYRNMVQWS
jgi:hypothetical protein